MSRGRVSLLLALELVLCIATGFWRLGRLSYWDDEVTSIEYARESPAEIWRDRDPNNSPFFYELLHVWRGWVGEDEAALRSLSAGARVLGLLAVFFAGSVMLGARPALVAGLLYVMSPAALLYGREVRAYPLLLSFSATAIGCLWLARERKSGAWAIAAGFALALALMMHYTTLFLIGGLVVAHLLPPLRRDWRFLGASLVVLGMTILPWAKVFTENLQHLVGAATGQEQVPIPFGPPGKAAYALFVMVLGETVLPWRWIVTVPAALSGIVLGVSSLRVLRARADLLILLLVPLLLAIIGLSFTMKAGPRYVFLLLPCLLVLLAYDRRDWIESAALGVLLACQGLSLANLYVGREYHNEAYLEPSREAAELLLENARPEDYLRYTAYPRPLLHYLAPSLDSQLHGPRDPYNWAMTPGTRVWVIEHSPGRAAGWIENRLEAKRMIYWLKRYRGEPTEWRFGHDPDATEKEEWVGKPFLEDRIVILRFDAK